MPAGGTHKAKLVVLVKLAAVPLYGCCTALRSAAANSAFLPSTRFKATRENT